MARPGAGGRAGPGPVGGRRAASPAYRMPALWKHHVSRGGGRGLRPGCAPWLGRLGAPGGRAFVPAPIGSSRDRRRRLPRPASPASCAPSPRARPRRAPGPASCAPGAPPRPSRRPPPRTPGRRSYCLMAATPAVAAASAARRLRLHLLLPPPLPLLPGPRARRRGGGARPGRPADPHPARLPRAAGAVTLGRARPRPACGGAAPTGWVALTAAWASVSLSVKERGPGAPSKQLALSWRDLDACQGHAL